MTTKNHFAIPAFAAVFLAPAVALAAPALVADVATGRVIYAEQATDPWFPASVTKLMTAYVTLEAVRGGRVKLDTPMLISARAASMAPSKMGFKPGLELTVDNALKIIMVKSANDVAVTLAEGVGGSVEGFSEMMNAAARRLGMRDSHFVNPHGLPDERNRTSARDLALLARALLIQFPEYDGYFSIGAIRFGKRVMNNHNGLMGRYPGADGMKTGFICASGFNVVATATRNGRRLVAVVLGSRSAKDRTIKTAQLLDRGFADLGWGGPGTLDNLPVSFARTAPDMRSYICGGKRGPVGEEEAAPPTPVAATTGSENPILDFFRQPAPAAPSVGRYTLGPRQAFEPLTVFVGRTPGAVTEVAETPARKVKAKGKGKAPAGKPETATAFAPEPSSAAGEAAPAALESATKPAGKPVLRPAVAAAIRPEADEKKAGSAARAKPGAIAAKSKAATADKPAVKAKPVAKTKPPVKSTIKAKAKSEAKPAVAAKAAGAKQ